MNFVIIYILIFINLIFSIYFFLFIYKIKSKPQNDSHQPNEFKINVVRFNPFNDLGGDQSFILTILNQNSSGVVLTSLHNRDITRIYAKGVKNGEGDNITLSKEEKSAINKTIRS